MPPNPAPARLSARFIGLCRDHPRWLALALGALGALGFQPLGLWPATLIALVGLLELVARAPGWRRAAAIGWLFGLSHFFVSDYWVATAFTYQANMPHWLGGFAVLLMALYLAVYPMIAATAAWLLARRGASLTLAFAGCWIVAEWLRSWLFTGFAWNPLAVTTLGGFARPGLALALPWLGTYALSGLVALLAGMIWIGVSRGGALWRRAMLITAPIAAFALPLVLPAPQSGAGALPFTLVQPDVRQENLDNPLLWESQFITTARLSTPRRPGQTRLVLWPESGLPDYLREGYPEHLYHGVTYAGDPVLARQRIGQVIGRGSLLLTGAVDLEIEGERAVAARNVITAVDAAGALRGSYAKAHLVPYGEYLPMRWLLEPLGASRLVAGALDFLPGPGPRTIDFGRWGKAGMQICYEIVFSGQIVDRAHRPDYIYNPSNDGWFGAWGPPQHLAQARLRAIEEGLPVLRATTTGISAVIDAHGVVVQHIPRHVAGRLDGAVPPPLAPTPFARVGNALPLGWAALLILFSLIALRRRKR